ncbi:MAG: DNA-3-methyladenine glycosylase 2 family protein [Burkholderiaceae bacterium]|nr:DNA-3-methyladenine glycosylase 2 family protein [Burkholderiaceae bacterium]
MKRVSPGGVDAAGGASGRLGRSAQIELPFTPPLDWPRLLRFFAGRATAGVETVEDGCYRRAIEWAGDHGMLTVWPHPERAVLVARVEGPASVHIDAMVGRLRCMFDLNADSAAISAVFASDPWMGELRQGAAGLRVPGTWSAFELVVRTIVGQQVSVKAATTIMGRLVARAGEPLSAADNAGAPVAGDLPLELGVGTPGMIRADADPGWRFPTPAQLACADLSHIGMPGKRVAALQGLAHAVAQGDLLLDVGRTDVPNGAGIAADLVAARAALLAMPGIGPWTVEYVAMRAWREADAWPATDLVLMQGMLARDPKLIKPVDQRLRAEAWRPYRAYAAVHIWSAAADRANGARGG